MTAPMFLADADLRLVPTLKPGELVVTDNLPVHKLAGVQEAIEAAGAAPGYRSPGSPYLNPWVGFSKPTALSRTAAERKTPDVTCRIGRVAKASSPNQCGNFLNQAGHVQT